MLRLCPSWSKSWKVSVRAVHPGSGTCLCSEMKELSALQDRCLLATVGPGFTFCQCQENLKCLCCGVYWLLQQKCSQTHVGVLCLTGMHIREPANSQGIHVCRFWSYQCCVSSLPMNGWCRAVLLLLASLLSLAVLLYVLVCKWLSRANSLWAGGFRGM